MAHEVVLHVYDLSMGMAKQMSPMLLGREIEMIPHTGVHVHGNEYFYGGGIQCMPHEMVLRDYHLPPIKKITLGTTSKSKEEVDKFVMSLQSKYTMENYDLFHNNCNHFSEELSQFLVSRSIPEDIVKLPELVLSTPLGQAIKPMLEGMQRNMSAHSMDPFHALRSQEASAPSAAPAAHLEPSKEEESLASVDFEKVTGIFSDGKDAGGSVAIPLAKLALKKITEISEVHTKERKEGVSEAQAGVLGDAELSSISDCCSSFSEAGVTAEPQFKILATCAAVQKCIVSWEDRQVLHPLFLARILVLTPEANEYFATTGVAVPETIMNRLHDRPYSSVASNVMGLTFLSNMFRHEPGTDYLICDKRLSRVLDLVARCLTNVGNTASEKQKVRLTASALLLNVATALANLQTKDTKVLVSSENLEEAITSILCSACEAFSFKDAEEDFIYRMVLACGILVSRIPDRAKVLFESLGLIEILHDLREKTTFAKVKGAINSLSKLLQAVTNSAFYSNPALESFHSELSPSLKSWQPFFSALPFGNMPPASHWCVEYIH